MAGYTLAQEHSEAPPGPAIQLNTSNEVTKYISNTTEADESTEHNGHIDPAEFLNVEVPLVMNETYSSINSTVLKNNHVSLLVTPVSVTLLSSSEIVTIHPESPYPFKEEDLEEIQDTLEENSEVFLNTVPNTTEYNPDEMERDPSKGSDESSGESPQINPELLLTNPTLSSDHATDGNISEGGTDATPLTEIKITLIPHLSFTPRREPEPSTPTPQESRSDREYSTEPTVNEKPKEISMEKDFTTTHSGIDGKNG